MFMLLGCILDSDNWIHPHTEHGHPAGKLKKQAFMREFTLVL